MEVTYQCINHLKKLSGIENTHIIVVDNGSPNQSGKKLEQSYVNDSLVSVIINQENLGFAKGNNLGYRYAKDKLKAKCIVVMNSDIYITDRDFILKLYGEIEKNNEVAIVAPDIINLNGIHCNPMIIPPISEKSIRKIYRDNLVRYFLYCIPILNKILWLRASKKEVLEKTDRIGWDRDRKDIVPDGSCIIFLPKWIRNEENAFVPITFMYAEEHILYEYLSSKKYISMYLPKLQVHHMEGATTGALVKVNVNQGIENKKRNLKWHSDSCKIYLKYKNTVLQINNKNTN